MTLARLHGWRDGRSRREGPGSSSPPTTRSATTSNVTRPISWRRAAAGCWARSARSLPRNDRLLLVPVASPVERRAGDRSRQRRLRHDQLHQAGGRVRHRPGRRNSPGCSSIISDVHALGLQTAQGLVLTETFYWDLNERTRALWRSACRPRRTVRGPGCRRPAPYASVLHYLKTAAADGCRRKPSAAGATTVAQHEGDADGRRRLRPRPHPRGRRRDPPRLSVRGKDTGREQAAPGTTTS